MKKILIFIAVLFNSSLVSAQKSDFSPSIFLRPRHGPFIWRAILYLLKTANWRDCEIMVDAEKVKREDGFSLI